MNREKVARSIRIGVIGCFCAGLLAGCKNETSDNRGTGETEIIIQIEKPTEETGSSTQVVTEDRDLSLKQFKNSEHLEEKWTAADAEGNTVTMQVDADIELPEEDHMYVLEVEGPALDAVYKEWLVKRLFGDEEGEYEEDKFTGKREGILYELSFAENGDLLGYSKGDVYPYLTYSCLEPKDFYQVCPEEFIGLENLDFYGSDMYLIPCENICRISQEEAQELAQHFVDELGMDYSELVESDELYWRTGTDGMYEDRRNGYFFSWKAGINEASYMQREYEKPDKKDDSEEGKLLDFELGLKVTDQGVIGAIITTPMKFTKVTEAVNFLPLDDVIGVLKEQTMSNIGAFHFEDTSAVTYNRMRLCYHLVKDKENSGHCSYVPAWCFYEYSENMETQNQVWINAIDGSVMNFYDEE